MRLDEAFERVFIINLPFKADRRERLSKHLKQCGIADIRKVVWSRGICGDWTPPPDWWGAGNGAWGCLMSHVRIAQDAIHDDLASYCVLEDDVVFHPRAGEMLGHFINALPADWGQVYLGGQFLHKEPDQINPWVVRPHNINRTHVFALNRSVMPLFIQHVMHAPDYFNVRLDDGGQAVLDPNFFHIDHQLGRAHEKNVWNTYAPTWWLAGQHEGTSNISGVNNPRMWWHRRDRGHQLPFYYIDAPPSSRDAALARKYLHTGYTLEENSLLDIGIKTPLDDAALLNWLRMIAEEAVERWRLPGFQVPAGVPDFKEQVRRVWTPGLLKVDRALLRAVSDYPFNGYFGGIPGES